MPSLYRNGFRKSNKRRAQFARQMMLAEFGHRYGRAIDQGDFVDRPPHQRPPTIYEIGGRS
jgi:hypothetical protein